MGVASVIEGRKAREFESQYSFPYEIVVHDDEADKYAADHPDSVQLAYEGMIEATELAYDDIRAGHPEWKSGTKEALRRAPGVKEWFPYLNTDLSLYFLSYPKENLLVPGIPLPEDLKEWQNLLIGIGIRERMARFKSSTIDAAIAHAEKEGVNGQRFNQLELGCGNGRNALTILREIIELGHNAHFTLLDSQSVSLERAVQYATEMNIPGDNYQIMEGDLFSINGILIKKVGGTAIGSTTSGVNLDSISSLDIPVRFHRINDSGVTGCYAFEDEWEQSEVSSFGPALDTPLRRAGQITLMQEIWKYLEKGGSYMRDSMNLVNPINPDGQLPLVDYLRHVINWQGLVPTTIHGDQGIEGEIGMLPMIEKAQLSGLAKVIVHISPNGVFNCYELLKAA
ncbi:class I SAM-dependent methyltransferase [Candidatus Saccharibacteria bacterium]|nr:class I SAM-dependent methyltransferase [Candidatus Saccharibacteria bacterium]